VLNGLNLVAQHAAMPLLDALLAWRKDAESQAQRLGGELVVLRKKVHLCSKTTCRIPCVMHDHARMHVPRV